MAIRSIPSYIQSVNNEWYRKRLYWIMAIILFAFAMLSFRLFYLQIIKGDYYLEQSKNNCIRIQRINAFRGLIFDRNGELLVENRPSFDLNIIPNDAKPLEKTIESISRYIQIPASEIMNIIRKKKFGYGFQPVLIKEDIGRDALAVISAHRFDLPGVFINCNARRNYVHETMAAHLIGYLGEINANELNSDNYFYKQQGDFVGRQGVEKTFDELLSGKPGGKIIQVNASGQLIKVLDTVEPIPADNIFLTIDYHLQEKAEALLQDKVGAIVAIDPSSGETLAMASSPSFDQNLFIDGISHKKWNELISDRDRPLTDKAITGEYPPGSTFKIITAIAGLEEKQIDPNSTVYCSGGYRFGDRTYGCWKEQGHGTVDLVRALAESCDVYFYQLGRRLGVDRLAWYAYHCGLGSKTGVDLYPESAGLIPTSEWKKKRFGVPWQVGENLSIAIGQGYDLVTPIQMSILISAVANGGTLFKPKIIKAITSVEGDEIQTFVPEVKGKLPASRQTIDIIQQGLWEVVNKEYGTARTNVHVDGIDISGKTGTSQVVSRRATDYDKKKRHSESTSPHAWFIGYAPSNNPQIAVAVIIEHGGHGASAAGPVAKELIVTYLRHNV